MIAAVTDVTGGQENYWGELTPEKVYGLHVFSPTCNRHVDLIIFGSSIVNGLTLVDPHIII